jgi:Ca-activated chloride channel family protein
VEKNNNSLIQLIVFITFILICCLIINIFNKAENSFNFDNILSTNEDTFKLISSSENEDLEDILQNYAKENNINLEIEYAGTLDIMEKLNSGEQYDAVWASNSIWLYMLNDDIKTSDSKSTSTNPVVFAVTKSKAEELGFIGKDIYTSDIIKAIQDGKLKFSMSNPTRTNTGATAYLGLLSSIAGSPEVLKEEHIESDEIKSELVSLFSGLERSSGSEEFLEELFLNGTYEAIVTYEASIININKELEARGEETLYVLYPVDGVSISDSPFAYIDNGDENKKQEFLSLQGYILSNEGQEEIAKTGRRTWYGGVSSNVDKTIFNPNWGIDTTKYIVPIKFPSTTIIQEALSLYQEEFRKPVHTVFCLDFSGSMSGDGYSQLKNAMSYILTQEEATKDLLQFTEKDKITVIPFSTNIIDVWNTNDGSQTTSLLNNILELRPTGSTNIYDTAIKALDILSEENLNEYNVSVILMTDGLSNMGSYTSLARKYSSINKEIPIYSIMFGNAYEDELQKIADLTNAKIFDGKTDLLKAFKEVRGYN